MTDILEKLRPDQDMQCYFERPSAIAAMSNASADGFTVSGTWRQQFDWAVIEWNRDNVFEHPAFRCLPDGDLSHLTLSYDERRINCAPIDSDVFPTEPWPYLRIWTEDSGIDPYLVPLRDHADVAEGSYTQAWCEFVLSGAVSQNDFVGLAFCGEHHTHQNYYDDTPEKIIEQIGLSINASSNVLTATWDGPRIRLEARTAIPGANGNRIGIGSYVSGASTEQWSESWQALHGGSSPTKWHFHLAFNQFGFPMTAVRKIRWTYAAELQAAAFERTEFQVEVSNWAVSGTNRVYRLAGPGTRRIENIAPAIVYSDGWDVGYGNFSGGSIAFTSTPQRWIQIPFEAAQEHELFLGTRLASNGAPIRVSVNGEERTVNLGLAGEDTLARIPLGSIGPGTHNVVIRHDGTDLQSIYFDFLELAVGVDSTPVIGGKERYTLATDWDTDHSIALPPERTAKMLKLLGFDGRANHYIGALWFYELCAPEHRYAVKKVRFEGQPRVNDIITMQLAGNVIEHLVHPGDTSTTVARAFALRLNQGYTAVWAEASGDELFVQARMMGCIGNSSSLLVTGGGSGFATSVETVQDGIDPVWRTDLNAQPRMNRAARDWTRAYVRALKSYGLAATCAFSMEIQHGDPSLAAGIAQRYPSGNPVQLLTPAIQTNFSPASIAFWRDVYADCAQLMTEAGVAPYLQFGEVQWWYFPYDGSGMPFYDGYTDQTFRELYGRAARRILNEHADPSGYQEEVSFYRSLVGQFTSEVMQYVRAFHPTCQFEVLYPTDVNESALNREVNFASQHWTASRLDCLKTESFTYTSRRDLNRARSSILFGEEVGFPWQQRSHLVGIADPTTPWSKEAAESTAAGVESVVLFALDQYCLIGYSESEMRGEPRSVYFGPS